MEKIGLVEAIDALRSELAAAVEKAQGQEIQFPIGSVQLEFQVGVNPTIQRETSVQFCGRFSLFFSSSQFFRGSPKAKARLFFTARTRSLSPTELYRFRPWNEMIYTLPQHMLHPLVPMICFPNGNQAVTRARTSIRSDLEVHWEVSSTCELASVFSPANLLNRHPFLQQQWPGSVPMQR